MNILQLKRNALGHRYQMPSESDGGNGSTGTSGATSSARGGSDGGGGSDGFGGSDGGGGSDGFGGYDGGGGSDGFGVFASTFNAGKDSQLANEQLGFEATNDAANAARMSDAQRTSFNDAMSKLSTEQRETIAAEVSRVSQKPPQERSVVQVGLLGMLNAIDPTPGKLLSKVVGYATAPDTPYSVAMSMAKDFSPSVAKSAGYEGPGFSSIGGGGGGRSQLTGTSAAGAQTTTPTQTPAEAAAAANKDPVTLATSIANQSWSDWQGDKSALQSQVATNTQRGNALYDSSMAAANGNMSLVNGMQSDYNNIYRPAGQQFSKYVGMLGSQGYQDQQAGQAMADVQQQSSMQQAIAQRNLQRSGVNPSSGRSLAMNNQNAIGTAAAMAGAGATSRRNTMADWGSGLVKMSDMGNATLGAAKGLDSSAQAWNTIGMNAGNTGFGQSTDLSKLSGFNASTSGGVAGTAANALYGQGALANANTNTQIAKDAANPWTTIGGAVITNAAKGIDWANIFKKEEDPLAFLG